MQTRLGDFFPDGPTLKPLASEFFGQISNIFYMNGRSDFEVDAVPLSCGMEKCARSMLQLPDLPKLVS